MQTKKEKRKNAEVSITGVLPKERVVEEHGRALARIQKEVELPGFRRGKVPIEKVREYVGEKALWKEAAESALKAEVETILKEHEVMPLLPVGAALKSADVDADVPFEIIAVVAPTCSTEEYKETAARALEKLAPFDEEKEKAAALEALRAQTRAMTGGDALKTDLKASPLTDEEAKKLGLENAAAAELFLAEEATRAAKERDVQRKRGAIAEALITKGSCDIPRIMVHEEARALLGATKKDIARRGLPWNEYLKQTGKIEETVLTELEAPAEKRVALDIIFGKIARGENMKPDEKEEERLAHVLAGQGVDHETAHRYIRATMLREKVWERLGAKSAGAV
jgi:FKBP-type peptidyl-prolyl cis-trans isomerase (trigger factor)